MVSNTNILKSEYRERYLVLPQANTHAQVYRMFQIIVENRPFILGTLVLVVFSALVFHILYPLVRVDSFAFYSYTFPQKISEIRFDTTTHKKSVEGSFYYYHRTR